MTEESLAHGHIAVRNKPGTQIIYLQNIHTSFKAYSHMAYYTPSLHWGPTRCIGQTGNSHLPKTLEPSTVGFAGGSVVKNPPTKARKMMLWKCCTQYASKFGKLSSGHKDWKMSVLIPISKKGSGKECSNYCTIALISHASKVVLKILQARRQ